MISSHYRCDDCDATGLRRELDVATVADDRDQMYGRPLGGSIDIYVCPHCGSENIDDWYTDESEEDEE